jgi:hypothetical protein
MKKLTLTFAAMGIGGGGGGKVVSRLCRGCRLI